MDKLEYATMEWLWDAGEIRVDHAQGKETTTGMYPEVVQMLNKLGNDGWEVCTCVANANWLYWTLKRSK